MDTFFTYSSVRYVNVEARCPAVVYRILQFAVLMYVVVYSIVVQHAYQVITCRFVCCSKRHCRCIPQWERTDCDVLHVPQSPDASY